MRVHIGVTRDIFNRSDLDLDRWLVIERSKPLGPPAGPSANRAEFKSVPRLVRQCSPVKPALKCPEARGGASAKARIPAGTTESLTMPGYIVVQSNGPRNHPHFPAWHTEFYPVASPPSSRGPR